MTARIRFSIVTRALLGCLLAGLIAGLGIVRSSPAQADSIPADPAAHGYIGFCGVDNRPMTGGSIHDHPFVWKAISSLPAPSEAQGDLRLATLYVVQPRPSIPATDWNGDLVSATDPYSTPQAPTVQTTRLDYALDFVVKDYPPMVEGLYEVRMYFGNKQNSGFTDQYAATFIRVDGDRWSVAEGGTVDCTKGKAISPEIAALGSASAAGTPTASAPYGGPSGTGVPKNARGVPVAVGVSSTKGSTRSVTKSGSGSGPGAGPAPASTSDAGLAGGITISDPPTSAAADPADPSAAASSSSSSGSSTWIVILLIVVVAIAAAGGWLAYRRSRAGTSH